MERIDLSKKVSALDLTPKEAAALLLALEPDLTILVKKPSLDERTKTRARVALDKIAKLRETASKNQN